MVRSSGEAVRHPVHARWHALGARARAGAAGVILAAAPMLLATAVCLTTNAGCGGGTATSPSNAVGWTARGWSEFQAGYFSQALSSFNAAIQQDSLYSAAYVGQGWTQLQLALTPNALAQALADFNQALALGQTSADTRSGRAATLLGIGGASLPGAVEDARASLRIAPAYTFQYRRSFDIHDLRLIESFALAGQGSFSAALAAADSIESSVIDENNPSSWIIQGIRYETFESAVLAFLEQLSNLYAG